MAGRFEIKGIPEMNITWKEFIEAVEWQGVKDNDEILFIDIDDDIHKHQILVERNPEGQISIFC